jgi:hypothetical protein
MNEQNRAIPAPYRITLRQTPDAPNLLGAALAFLTIRRRFLRESIEAIVRAPSLHPDYESTNA